MSDSQYWTLYIIFCIISIIIILPILEKIENKKGRGAIKMDEKITIYYKKNNLKIKGKVTRYAYNYIKDTLSMFDIFLVSGAYIKIELDGRDIKLNANIDKDIKEILIETCNHLSYWYSAKLIYYNYSK